jgi:hypothetical protein
VLAREVEVPVVQRDHALVILEALAGAARQRREPTRSVMRARTVSGLPMRAHSRNVDYKVATIRRIESTRGMRCMVMNAAEVARVRRSHNGNGRRRGRDRMAAHVLELEQRPRSEEHCA